MTPKINLTPSSSKIKIFDTPKLHSLSTKKSTANEKTPKKLPQLPFKNKNTNNNDENYLNSSSEYILIENKQAQTSLSYNEPYENLNDKSIEELTNNELDLKKVVFILLDF